MKIGFKNFRRFKSFPKIELGGCTFLVGSNNSGKSTLIKAILLIGNNIKYRDYSSLFQPFMCNFSFGNNHAEHLYLGDFWSNINSESDNKQIEFSLFNSDTCFDFIIDGNSLDDDLPSVKLPVRENKIYNETFDVTFKWIFEDDQKGTIEYSYNPQRVAEWLEIRKERILNSDIHNSHLFNKPFDVVKHTTDKTFREHIEAIDSYLESAAIESRSDIIARIEKAIAYYRDLEEPLVIIEPFQQLNEIDIVSNYEKWPDLLYDFFCDAKEIMSEDFMSCKEQIYIEAHNATHKNLLNIEDKNDYLAQTVLKYINLIGGKDRNSFKKVANSLE